MRAIRGCAAESTLGTGAYTMARSTTLHVAQRGLAAGEQQPHQRQALAEVRAELPLAHPKLQVCL